MKPLKISLNVPSSAVAPQAHTPTHAQMLAALSAKPEVQPFDPKLRKKLGRDVSSLHRKIHDAFVARGGEVTRTS